MRALQVFSDQRPGFSDPAPDSSRLNLQFHRQGDRELRSFAFFALDDDLAAHEIDEFFDDGQSETRAAVLARARHVGLAELIKDVAQRFRVHADAGVGHGKLYETVVAPGGDLDLALFGKLGGVAQQIDDRLLELVTVGFHRQDIPGDVGKQFDSAISKERLHGGCGHEHDIVEFESLGEGFHAAWLDLYQVEQLVDQIEQMVRTDQNFLQVFLL